MTVKWPWDRSEAMRHAERVEGQAQRVERVYRQGAQQKAENNVGALLQTLFVTPPKEPR